jgi:PAS domain S-box-containing protein
MSLHVEPLSSLPQLRGLLEVTRLVRDERDLTRLVDRIAATISTSLGWGTVSINLFRPAVGDFQVTTVHGNEAARNALLGTTRSADAWAPLLAERFLRRGAYLIPHDEADWGDLPSHVPDFSISSDPDAWHPEDALIVPMRGADRTLLGVVSVDEPHSGVRPTDEELDVLVAFAEHVIVAFEGAQLAAEAARDRASLRRLLDVSASLVDLDTVDSVLENVARGIQEALEFEKVAVCLAHEGNFSPSGTAGWETDDPGLDFGLTDADLDVLLVPEFEIEGCYLIEDAVATELVGDCSSYVSHRGGAGPRAWSNHWLLVPLIERDGSRSGFIWADDPSDSLLPSRERLQALRTFANQATMALRAALDFEMLNARNSELDALHTTTVGLLERLDLDSVLTRIMESACSLVGTPHGYLALIDDGDEVLRTAVKLGLLEERPAVTRRGEGVAGRVWESGESMSIDDYSAWSGRADGVESGDFHATIGVPLRAAGEVVGVIGLSYREPGQTFGPVQVALIERFAQLASLALENARLYGALRQSEELHRQIVDCSTDLISVVDLEGTIVVISPSVFGTLGVPPEEMVGTYFAGLVHPDDLAGAEEMFSNAIGGSFSTTTVRVRHADGSWVLLDAIASVIVGPDGKPQHILATGRDVTESQRLEEQLRQAQKMESVGRLAGGIAHDFNNLLTAIRGYAELMLIDFDAGVDPGRDCAEQIARAADRAASLTGQLLAFSRKQVLRPQLIDLNDVVEGMSTMLARMLGEDVLLSTELDPKLGPTLADPTQLEQVVLNLAINARDAMPNGGRLVLRTERLELGKHDELPHPDLAAGSYVTLIVRDTGIGIDPGLAEQIFEPFFTTKDVGEGTGLGLSTVHGIVTQSGGAIWVDSALGEGTCFTVCLPIAAPAAQPMFFAKPS